MSSNNSVNNKPLQIYLPLIIALAILAGIFIGKTFSGYQSMQSEELFKVYSTSKNFNKLNEIINYIENEYVDTVEKNTIVEETVQHILQELDPHSYYISAEELQSYNEPLEGNFEGIGVQFNILKDTIIVITAISGGPSERVGIMAGDRIIEVDSQVVAGIGITNKEVIAKLKGKKGTKVNLGVQRRGASKLLNFTITRDKIPIYSVDASYMIQPTIGYVKVNRFAKTTYEEFATATEDLKNQGMQQLILDLRGNGGGFLDAAIDMADEFLANNLTIVYTEGRKRSKKIYTATRQGGLESVELIVLVDEGSASASEIVAGAVQDNDRGLILGRRTFGKGLVQEQTSWPDGSATRLTTARYYTPVGRCIQRPYDNGVDDYYEQFNHRYERGEFTNADSIQLPDSLKYTTPKGKVVYGGGGIMPDVFIPIDTSGASYYLSEVSYKGLLNEFGFNYADKHRAELLKYNNAQTMAQQWKLSDAVINEFIAFAEKNGVPFNQEEFNISKARIVARLRAHINRTVFGQEGFYREYHVNDNALNKAIQLFETPHSMADFVMNNR